MFPVSDAFKTRVRGSHTRTVRAVMQDPTGTALLTLSINSGGAVSIDSRRDVRRTATDLTLVQAPGDDLVPDQATDPLSPLTDNEVAIYRGVILADGTVEEVPLGVFGFETCEAADSPDGLTISITGLADRSRIVTRSRWRYPYSIPAGSDLADSIQDALRVCWSSCPTLVSDVDITIGALVVFTEGADSDPWKDLCSLASAHGCELFFDAAGNPVLRVIPTPDSDNPAAVYADGADAVLLDVKRSLSIAQGSYNGIIVSAESTSATVPIRAEWWDNDQDPTMPPARPRPVFFVSSMITNAGQALSTAQRLLPKYLGATEVLSWSQLVNPAHDAWDLVRLVRGTVKADTDVLLDNLTVPLTTSDPMTAVGRARQVWGA